ncbi:MAG: hypothetical protein OEU56_18370, partial [Rhodospirillales bacterium]|nr:hypothetical protein [Rhodospirillales bacterium]
CETGAELTASGSYYGYESAAQLGAVRGRETVSLFSSDSAILSDADVKRILEHRFSPRRQNKIGILAIGQEYWFGWSDELARSGVEVQEKLVSKLRSSPLVHDATYLPSLLIPEKRSVGHFREAGARYQADLLLIYRAACRSYEKSQFFGPDNSKSFCNIEAVLLDTRTGIVPFAATASRDSLAKRLETDFNLYETMRRTELEALADALAELGEEVVAFLAAVRS